MSLIKHYENNLLVLKFEDLLHFLINDIIKHGFFLSSNYDHFIDLTKNIKIQAGLVSNLENEFNLEIKVREIDEKRKNEELKIITEKDLLIKN